MSRLSNNKRCFFLLSALTAALLWLAPARSGLAAAYTYNARQRTINAGVLFVGSAPDGFNYAPDPTPYVFYVLNQRPDAKPVGWSFVNPLAQATVSTAMSTRWGGAYSAGDSLRPTMASYWEVALRDVSADDLQQFDVLYLVGSYIVSGNTVPVTFTPADNEKLRRFVDGGGQLIVEYGVGVPAQPTFSSGVLPLFTGASWITGTDNTLTPPVDLHPILTQPNFLQPLDFSFLGQPSPSNAYGTISVLGNSDYNNLFTTVLSHSGGGAVTAAQLGGGQIVTSTLNIGPAVSPFSGAILPVTFNPAAAPAADLKFLSNVISWADTHPTENKTSHQNAAGPSSASFTSAWSFVPANATASAPPGAAIYGNYIYVTDSAGTLHAFDAIPSEGLTGLPADDGLQDFSNTTATPPPTPYDEIWNASPGAGASAPTVASYGGSTYVFVETANGSVQQFSSLPNTPAQNMPPMKTFAAPGTGTFSGHAPAPTYYDGRIYAGEPDGTMFVIALSGGSAGGNGVSVPVDPTAGGANSTASVTASPAVSLLESGPVSNSIVALVPTTQNMNTVLLGARNDPLSLYSPNGQFGGFNVNRLARYSLFNLFINTASSPTGRAYDSNGNILAPSVSSSRDPVFQATNTPTDVDNVFGDWDSDFALSTTQGGNAQAGLTLHEIKALSLSNTAGGGAILSAPAIDRHGDYYYTVDDGTNSYLFGIHDDIAQRNVRIKFRFRLPRTGDTSTINPTGGANWGTPNNAFDADNVNYNDTNTNGNGASNSLMDYRFVGAPVVDGQGNVYVAAQNGGNAAVLAFSGDQEVTANPPGNAAIGFDATQSRYFQLDESAGNAQNPLVAIPSPRRAAGRYGQITTAGNLASIFNFGRGSGGSRQIAGNLCEPQPFTATPSGPNGGTATWMYFHTNLSWYATFPTNGTISGVSKAGSTLLLCDSGGGSVAYNTLYKLPATPTIGAGKVAALTVRKAPLGTAIGGAYLNIGAVIAAPSAGGGAMVVNGSAGIAAFNQQLTLIADNNRILEVDADGNAVWSADATTRAGANNVSTRVDFAHPSALAQFAPNDYLVADTGNNRCVRFDRGANVIWELTRFYDPSGLMAPGQPFTLSQPTSVEVRRETDSTTYKDPVSQQPITVQFVHYLVADTGNDRIVEVTDTLDAAGNLLSFDTNTPAKVVPPGTAGSVTHDHLLTWVTHTGDNSGRRYQYAGASYLDIPGATQGATHTIEVFALITNARLAALTQVSAAPPAYALGAASGDAPGGSIVAFLVPAPQKPFSALGPNDNDIQYVATSYTANTATGSQTLSVRNPRFLHIYAPPQGLPATPANYAYSFLYADSNGAFDLVYTGTPVPVSYGLAFTQANYQSMTIPADAQDNIPTRGGAAASSGYPAIPPIPFVPTCVQRINDDETNRPGINHVERYLITQSYSQGELGTLLRPALPLPPAQPNIPAIRKAGGEIFEVDVSTSATGVIKVDPIGGFGGGLAGVGNPPVFNGPLVSFTLSHPVGASPLTQPTSATRTTQ